MPFRPPALQAHMQPLLHSIAYTTLAAFYYCHSMAYATLAALCLFPQPAVYQIVVPALPVDNALAVKVHKAGQQWLNHHRNSRVLRQPATSVVQCLQQVTSVSILLGQDHSAVLLQKWHSMQTSVIYMT